ncbi:MAG: ABC transporter ATP-binding protein [Candidatus Aminicenantes bacterium]|jgi:putative ABC transport system ATP-binding protein|nr:ABC transporter ATP-binding protein [Candidatus Aminicenantes bacterium]NLH75457.1 ABC transporter ATP-binding protein [Acidobacteriota bacterium]
MSAPPLVRVRGLARTYAVGDVRVAALEDVSLDIGEGRFVAVTGASGSGKSTLLNLLGGLDTPTAGTIEVGGVPVSGMDREALARYRRSVAGMIFQSFNLVPARTALENVELPLVFAGVERAERRRRAAALLEQVGLARRGGHRPAELSGGEQQRVAVARALANGPRLLLADEPTGNLDSATSREIVGLLAGLNRDRGLTVVMVTHEEALVREFADEVVRLRDGRVAAPEVRP